MHQPNGQKPDPKAGMGLPATNQQQRPHSERESAAMYTRDRDQRRYTEPGEMNYPALLKAIREELQPLQHDMAELTQQMRAFEQRYYPKELIDAQNKLQTTILEGLKNDIANLASRPAQALNNWVAIAVIGGGLMGAFSLIFQHLAIH